MRAEFTMVMSVLFGVNVDIKLNKQTWLDHILIQVGFFHFMMRKKNQATIKQLLRNVHTLMLHSVFAKNSALMQWLAVCTYEQLKLLNVHLVFTKVEYWSHFQENWLLHKYHHKLGYGLDKMQELPQNGEEFARRTREKYK